MSEAPSQTYIQGNQLDVYKLSNKQRRTLQHEFKIHLDKYFKDLIGKGLDYSKVIIWDDMIIIRGERFLTEVETFIATTPKGSNLVKASRLQVAKQFAIDNLPYFEEKLEAKCVHQTYDVDSCQDFWIHVMVFDQLLIEQ